MADNSVRINFIKTFVNTAGVMMDGLQIEKGRDMWYWRSAREVAELYPALKLAAAELNRNCGFRVSVPDDSPQGAFPAAEAFYHLYREIAEQGEGNEDFVRARVLFNPGNGDFAKDVNAVSDWVAKSGSEFDRYWLNRGMVLSAAFAGEMQDEIFSGMMDEFLETRLAERMMRTVIRRGGVINVSDVEGVRSVLADVAENFSKMPGFVSEKKVAAEVAKLLQKECSWDVRSEQVRKTVAEFTDQFTQIVARNRADFYLYYRNQDAARAAAADFDNVMSDETYFRLERNSRLNQHLGIGNADFEIPEHYDLKKIFAEVDNVGSFAADRPLFKPGSPEEYWDNYENAENISGALAEDVEKMIAQIIRAADNDLYETGVLLNELEDRSFDDEDEDDEFAESWRPAEYADMSGDWEKKKAVLDFAAEVLDIAAVVKSYYDIELNDTPVDRKVVREFKPEGFWDDFTFSSLHMLFNAFDRNLGENQVVLLSSRGIRYEAVDELAALPQSLEKRNALKLFDKGLRKMEISAIENKKRLESDTAEDFSIYHQEDYRQLVSELRWGQEVFRSLTDDVVGRLAVDINAAAVLNYVLPVYDDTAPDVSAPRSTLTGIGDYERQPGEVQKYIKGLTRRHIARVLKTHRRVLDDGDFDRGLFADIEALGKSQLTLKSIAAARRNNERALAAEETVYRRYRAFRKTHPDRAKLLANALWQGRICNN